MAFDLFSIGFLNRVLEDQKAPSSFLLDKFFPDVEEATAEEIYFDDVTKRRRLAPFVSPLREGRVVDMPGYQTKSFRPAYVKDKRVFEATARLRRQPGEPLGGGTVTPTQRLVNAVAANMEDQLQMLTRREEWMAAQVLRTGQLTVSGEGYPSTVVSFGRNSGQTVTLSGAARWGQAGVSPLANLETWRGLVQTNGGGNANNVIMDAKAWALFAADPAITALLTNQAYRGLATLPQEPVSGYRDDQEAIVIDRGFLGDYHFWQYQTTDQDDNGAEQQLLPDYTVILASPGRMMGTRCYGLIRDLKANFEATRFFVKSWEEEDPSVRFILLQSAPLVVPFRPNATFCATVN
jgi:hypothetical protein